MAVAAEAWLALMRREYLDSYIAEGGGAVRFAVAEAAVRQRLAAGLRADAVSAGLYVVGIDLAATRLHMLQDVVFAIAAALDWDRLLQARLEALSAEAGYGWPTPGVAARLPALAEAHGVAPHLLRRELMAAMTRQVWSDHRLTQDFRNAMIALLEHRLTGEDPAVAEAVAGWLRGTQRSLAALKPAGIGRRVGRQNARATLISLCHWVRGCDGAGLLLLLDLGQLHLERGAATDGLTYTPAAVMDCYEVLRQLIDDAGEAPGLFVAALAGEAMLSDNPKRSLAQYTALQMRVWDDVRPQAGDNLLAPLVRVAA